jgi:cation transport ATPase
MLQIGCIAGIIGGLAVLLIALLMPRKNCPSCGYKLPRFRKPASGKQALHGGWTCPNCGVELDRSGKLVSEGVKASSSAARVDQAPTKVCPRCAEKIQLDALVCKHCGQEFSEAEVQAARQQIEEQAQLARQAAQEKAAQAQLERQTKGRRSQGMVFLVLGVLVALVGAIAAIIFLIYAFSEQARATGALAAMIPFLCTLPFLALGVWLIILGRKRRSAPVE